METTGGGTHGRTGPVSTSMVPLKEEKKQKKNEFMVPSAAHGIPTRFCVSGPTSSMPGRPAGGEATSGGTSGLTAGWPRKWMGEGLTKGGVQSSAASFACLPSSGTSGFA